MFEDDEIMKRFVSLLALSFCVSALSVPAASALTPKEVRECKALHASFPQRTADIQKDQERLLELAEVAERAGEAWQNAENVRTLSAEHAAEADALRPAYEQTRDAFNSADAAFFEKTKKFKDDQFKFNTVCAA